MLGAIAVAGASVLTDAVAMAVVLVSGASAGVGAETMAGGWRLAAAAVAACSRLKGPLPVALPQ